MSCPVSPALGRAEMLPWVQKCADTNPSCCSDCRGVLNKGYVRKKPAESEVLLHHSLNIFHAKHFICWTAQARNVTFQKSWVGACSINHWYSLLLANSVFFVQLNPSSAPFHLVSSPKYQTLPYLDNLVSDINFSTSSHP